MHGTSDYERIASTQPGILGSSRHAPGWLESATQKGFAPSKQNAWKISRHQSDRIRSAIYKTTPDDSTLAVSPIKVEKVMLRPFFGAAACKTVGRNRGDSAGAGVFQICLKNDRSALDARGYWPILPFTGARHLPPSAPPAKVPRIAYFVLLLMVLTRIHPPEPGFFLPVRQAADWASGNRR